MIRHAWENRRLGTHLYTHLRWAVGFACIRAIATHRSPAWWLFLLVPKGHAEILCPTGGKFHDLNPAKMDL